MSQRNSHQEQDGTIWATASLRLGSNGVDLRRPSDPPALADLINARFLDERTLRRRDGYLGTSLVDGDTFPPLGDIGAGAWVYGHGNQVEGPLAYTHENVHLPIVKKGCSTFHFEGSDVVWTGDRLLVPQSDGPALGSSAFWWRDTSDTAPLARGIPAYLPAATDDYPPSEVSGSYIDTCLSDTQRFYVNTDGSGGLWALVLDRTSGQLLSRTEISGASNDPRECRVFISRSTPVVVWRDHAATALYISHWNGQAWSAASEVTADALAFDIAIVSTGFHLLYRTALGALKLTRYDGATAKTAPYGVNTTITTDNPGGGPVAITAAPDGTLGIAYVNNASAVEVFQLDGNAAVISNYIALFASNTAGFGLTICSRLLKDDNQRHEWVIHACTSAAAGVVIKAVKFDAAKVADVVSPLTTRFNSTLASKSFRVGDEVFAWLRSTNAGTHYLLGGVKSPVVAGYADREEALAMASVDGNYGLPGVAPDPNDPYTFTWVRSHSVGQYTHAGAVRVGTLDFLPQLSAVQYGRSMYLSGSAVKNYDGETLADAGFQDYPVEGSAYPAGTYQFRVYAVWYNARGERFESAALTFSTVFGISGTLLINTLPSVTQDGVIFEIYRTENGGSAFYLDGTVANSFDSATVSYTLGTADADLIKNAQDPHAPAVGITPTLESFGPLGCSILTVVGDRLWGAGGQVPAGQAQFSLLKTENAGAGFDDVAGSIDASGEGGAITSICGQNNAIVLFQRDRIFVLGGTGPDNYGNGSYSAPQLVLAAGATTHFGTTLIQPGVLYWGEGGPMLLEDNFTVRNVSSEVRPLTSGLTPTGVQSDTALMEVVWFTDSGDAVLFNYMAGSPRWAKWKTPSVVGCSPNALITDDGVLLVESDGAAGDNGAPFAFSLTTGDLRPEELREGYTLIRSVGINGQYLGDHKLRLRVYYNGSPLWGEETTWDPSNNTWLESGSSLSTLTPAQIDALAPRDRSGAYSTHKRTSRQACHYFRVEVSDISATGPTYLPYELAFEIGQKPGLGRTPVNTFTP